MYRAIKQGKKEFKLADKGAEASKKLVKTGGTSQASAEGTTHSFTEEEKYAFVDWINYLLVDDPDMTSILPMNGEDNSLFDGVENGIMLWFVCYITRFRAGATGGVLGVQTPTASCFIILYNIYPSINGHPLSIKHGAGHAFTNRV